MSTKLNMNDLQKDIKYFYIDTAHSKVLPVYFSKIEPITDENNTCGEYFAHFTDNRNTIRVRDCQVPIFIYSNIDEANAAIASIHEFYKTNDINCSKPGLYCPYGLRDDCYGAIKHRELNDLGSVAERDNKVAPKTSN